MRTFSIVLIAALLCGSTTGTEAAGASSPKPIMVPYYPGMKNAAALHASFAPSGAQITPGQVAVCANLAALRALGARSAGADYANQSRMADLTFALCLAASPANG